MTTHAGEMQRAVKIVIHLQDDLIVVAFGKGTEDADGNCSDYETTNDRLEEDSILDSSKGWLLDPHFAIQNLA